jgi:hypothetical protein
MKVNGSIASSFFKLFRRAQSRTFPTEESVEGATIFVPLYRTLIQNNLAPDNRCRFSWSAARTPLRPISKQHLPQGRK